MSAGNFVFFGDSICFGQGISPHLTWVSRLSTEICATRPDLSVINTSINGNTTRMALDRMAFDVQSHGIAGILIQFGMNDCNYWVSDKGHPRVSKRAFVANLIEIIDRARIFGAQQVLLNTNHKTTRLTPWAHLAHPLSYQESNEEYSELIREVAKITEARLTDMDLACEKFEQSGGTVKDLLLDDELHLSLKGHDFYFNQLKDIVLSATKSIK